MLSIRSIRFAARLCLFAVTTTAVSAPLDPSAKKLRVPDGFVIEPVAGPEQVAYGMCATLDDRGRLFVTESSGRNMPGKDRVRVQECRIRLLEDADGDGFFESARTFAGGLSLPMGAGFHQGSLYVASPPEFLRFEDTDGDGVADVRETIHEGWNVKNTASLHGPFLGPDGYLYLTHGRHGYEIQTREGEEIAGLAARVYRLRADGTGLERICGGGFDNPVELAFTPGGEMFCTMTYIVDPKEKLSPAGMRDALIHIVEGGVFPKRHESIKEFVVTGELLPPMVRLARVAPAGFLRYRSEAFGKDFQGQYFSAQFNPHQVRRHVITPKGATYLATDEAFLTSDDPDFHPTDVIEDADGSLLVIDTGGWYLQACPISRIAKPEIKGGIWRIRKADAPRIEDPRGVGLKLESRGPSELVRWIDDPRFAVRDRVAELLVRAGVPAVGALRALYAESKSARARNTAIWCQSRIGTPEALETVRRALTDEHAENRIAAGRCLGLHRDKSAREPLQKMLLDDESPHARRQAATALGRIGDGASIPALFDALAEEPDRFLEHAITYALFQCAGPADLVAGLAHDHPVINKAALLGLEQLHPKALQRDKVAPLLQADHEGLRDAVLWVLARHPDWSGDIVAYLDRWLGAGDLSAEKFSALRNGLVTFATNEKIQGFVAQRLADARLPIERRGLLMEVVALYPGKELPKSWAEALAAAIERPDVEARSQAVATIRTRGVTQLDRQLLALVDDDAQPDDLRLAALSVCIPRRGSVTDKQFALLIGHLSAKTDTLHRITAAESIARAALSEAQYETLLDRLPSADALVFTSLVNAPANSESAAVGKRLIEVLLESERNVDRLTRSQLDRVLAGYPQSVREAAKPLYEKLASADKAQADVLARLMELTTGGNVRRGREIFFSKTTACGSCHRVGEEGGRIGPDLTKVGAVRSARDLLESIVFPSASFAQGYETYLIQTNNGLIYDGVIIRQTADTVTLRAADNVDVRIDRGDIQAMKPSTLSIMPQGLDKALTDQQLQDLLAYVQSLR